MLAGRVNLAARNLVRPLRVELGCLHARLSVPTRPLAGLDRFSPSALVTRLAHSHSRPLDAVHAMSKPYKKRVIQADSDESDNDQPEVRTALPPALPLRATCETKRANAPRRPRVRGMCSAAVRVKDAQGLTEPVRDTVQAPQGRRRHC